MASRAAASVAAARGRALFAPCAPKSVEYHQDLGTGFEVERAIERVFHWGFPYDDGEEDSPKEGGIPARGGEIVLGEASDASVGDNGGTIGRA